MITKDFEFTIKIQAICKEDIDDKSLQHSIKYELDRSFGDYEISVEGEEVYLRSIENFNKILSKRI